MTRFDNHAVFIGVDDYSTFDESTGAAKGTSDLPGSRNDAAVFWRLQRQLGIPAANLRILTSPRLDLSLLEGATEENAGEATEQEILQAAEWLAAALAASSRPSGFLAYSGHGGWLEGKGLVLCPSDVSGVRLEHAIAYATLHRIFAERRAAANLTVLLDCCHSGARSPRADRISASLSRLPLPARLAEGIPLIGSRVLTACGPMQSSYQARIGGVYRGAFSWAVSSVMDQWRAKASHGGVELELSYGDLVRRAGQLLDVLSFEQTPVLRGRPGVASLPVFHTGEQRPSEETAADPTAERYGGQLDPDCRYALTFGADTSEVLSTGTTIGASYSTTYNPSTEYWSLTDSFLRAVEGAAAGSRLAITQSQNPIDWSSLGFPVQGALSTFSMPSSTVWTQMSRLPPSSAFYSSANGQYTGLLVELAEPSGGAPWGGSLTWFLGSSSGGQYLANTYAVGSAGLTLTKGDAPRLPAGYSWYSVQLTPLTWPTAANDMQRNVYGAAATFSSSTSSTRLQNKIWLAYTKENGSYDVCIVSSTDGVTWTSETDTGGHAGWMQPSLAILDTATSGGTLYVAYWRTVSGIPYIFMRSSADGTTWSGEIETGKMSDYPPALAALNGQLHMVYASVQSPSPLWAMHTSDPQSSSSWSTAVKVADSSRGIPAMTVFNGQLYLAFSDGSAIQVFTSADGSAWTKKATLWGGLSSPSITAFNGFLYIASLDASSNVWICSSPDGTSWSGYGDLSVQVSAVRTQITPALCPASATALVLAHVGGTSGYDLRTITAT